MNNWKCEKLERVCLHITDGKHGDCRNEENSGFYFLSCKDVVDGRLNYTGARQITEADFLDTHRRTKFAPSDILITNSGTIGRMALAPDNELTKRTTFQKSVAILKPLRDRVDPSFLYYALQADVRRLIGFAGGTAQKNLLLRDLRAFEVPTPPMNVQQRVANILTSYDSLIEINRRRIELLEEMARRLFAERFVHFRGLSKNNETFIELETGRAPAGWKTGRLDHFLDVLETGNRPKGGVAEITEGVPSIGAESIIGIGRFDFMKTRFVPRDYFASMRSGILKDRDVLVYKDGGRPGIFIPHVTLFGSGFPFEEMAINSHVYRLRAKDGISQEYLYFYLSSEAVLHWMHMHGSGAAIPSLSREDLKQLPFVQPDAVTHEKFNEFVQPLVGQILSLARQIQNLRRTRDLLLPRLISGELAVAAKPELEAVA